MIIGVTGTLGSGKGEVARYLVKEKGFRHYSSREIIAEEVIRRGMPVNRDTLTEVANDMRRIHGPTYPQPQSYEHMQADGAENAVLESVREIPGAEFIKSHGGFIIGVDADQHLRYERVTGRKSATDDVDFDTFATQEKREMTSTDPNKQNIAGVMAMADITLHNDGSFEEFHAQIDAALEQFKQKSQ